MAAGCSMADMAAIDQVESCWEELGEMIDTSDFIPVTYINSAASLKAFCGRHGGIVCTSSNAAAVLKWAFARASRVLFFPDQHLGRNTAKAMGIPLTQMAVWNPHAKNSAAIPPRRYKTPKCSCGRATAACMRCFAPSTSMRWAKFPGIKVLVHPECPMEVVDKSDSAAAPAKLFAPSKKRRRHEMGDRHRVASGESFEARTSGAGNSFPFAGRVHVRHDVPHRSGPSLLGLENLAAGQPVNVIQVDPKRRISHWWRWSGCWR